MKKIAGLMPLVTILFFISTDQAYSQSKVKSFQNVPALRANLSKVGIGSMRKWWTDGAGWMSASNYYEFGPAVNGALYDNLAFYLESPSERYVETLKLNLTAYHKSGANSAYHFMANKAPKLFSEIGLPMPPGLVSAIKSRKEFVYNGKTHSVKTDYDYVAGAKAESYRLIITSK